MGAGFMVNIKVFPTATFQLAFCAHTNSRRQDGLHICFRKQSSRFGYALPLSQRTVECTDLVPRPLGTETIGPENQAGDKQKI
jgi:hypothetical protein